MFTIVSACFVLIKANDNPAASVKVRHCKNAKAIDTIGCKKFKNPTHLHVFKCSFLSL